jgi:hypothetical protein
MTKGMLRSPGPLRTVLASVWAARGHKPPRWTACTAQHGAHSTAQHSAAQRSVESFSWIYKMRYSSLHDQDPSIAVHETYMQGLLRCKCKEHATWPGAQATSRALRSAARACDCEQKPSAAVHCSVLSVLCCAVLWCSLTTQSCETIDHQRPLTFQAAQPTP